MKNLYGKSIRVSRTKKSKGSSPVSTKKKNHIPDRKEKSNKSFQKHPSSSDAISAGVQKILDKPVLKESENVEEVDAYLACTQAEFDEKALGTRSLGRLPPHSRVIMEALLKRPSATSIALLAKNKLMTEAYHRIRTQLFRLAEENPTFEFAMITFISGDGETSLYRPHIDLHGSRSRVQKTLCAMAPNHIGITELAFFNSHTHKRGGPMLSRHEHAVVFGPNILCKASQVARQHAIKFALNFTDAATIRVSPLYDHSEVNMARIAAYLVKSPHLAMTYYKPASGENGNIHHSEKGDRTIRYFRMAQLRTLLPIEHMIFGARLGLDIKREFLQVIKPTAKADAPIGKRLIHPDALFAFCSSVTEDFGKKAWSLPIITRQK